MRNRTLRITGTLFLLWAVLVMLVACPSGGRENMNSPTSQNSNTESVSGANVAIPSPTREPCDETDMSVKRARLQAEADADTNDNDLEDQRDNKHKWKITVEEDPDYGIRMRISGRIKNTSAGDAKLKKLLHFLDKQTKNMKRGCVGKVVFEALPGSAPVAPIGFEWVVCESPNEVCENGQCLPACLMKGAPTPSVSPTTSPTVSPTTSPAAGAPASSGAP